MLLRASWDCPIQHRGVGCQLPRPCKLIFMHAGAPCCDGEEVCSDMHACRAPTVRGMWEPATRAWCCPSSHCPLPSTTWTTMLSCPRCLPCQLTAPGAANASCNPCYCMPCLRATTLSACSAACAQGPQHAARQMQELCCCGLYQHVWPLSQGDTARLVSEPPSIDIEYPRA